MAESPQTGKEIVLGKPQKPKKTKQGVEMGDSGTAILAGIVTEEYNPKLQDVRGVETFDQMRKSDGTVQAAVKAVTLPIRSARWYVEPASEDKADLDIARFIEACFMEFPSGTFADLMRHACLSLPLGVMAFEKVFGVREWEGQSRIVWHKLAPRLPKSISKFSIGPDNEKGITQRTSTGATVEIPIEKLIIIVNEQEGENWWGSSILRPAHKHWFIKNTIYKIDAIAFERQGLGIPYAKLPESFSASDKSDVEEVLKNIRANHQAYAIVPHDFELAFMDMGAKSTRDPDKSITHHNREIMKSVLAQFLELGAASGSGSRSLSENHSTLFLQSLEAVAQGIADAFNKYGVEQLVDLNFEGVQNYPKLRFTDIKPTDAKALADTYKVLKDAGAIIVGENDEPFFRETLNLPERDMSDDEEKDDQAEDPVDPEAKKEDVDEDDPDKTVEARRFSAKHCGSKKKIDLADGDPSYWRLATPYEMKVDLPGIEKKLDELEKQFDKDTRKLLGESHAKYLAALTKAVMAGDVDGVKKASMQAQKEYSKIIRNSTRSAFEYGKTNAAKEIGQKAPISPSEVIEQIDIAAVSIAEQHLNEITNEGKLAYTTAVGRGVTVTAALAAADAAVQAAIDRLITDTAAIVMASSVNWGRDVVFDEYEDMLYAKQRSEILDNRTCNYCLSVDGRIVEKGDPFSKNRIFHSKCRGIWVGILLDEDELPPIGGIPKSIRDRFGGDVNDLIQPKDPITQKDSLARKEAERRLRREAKQ